MKKDNNELFIEKYKELEYIVQEKYKLGNGTSPIAYLLKKNEFSEFRRELDYCREIRNFLQHEGKLNDSFLVSASDEMIKLLDRIIKIINDPVKCIDICKKVDNIYSKKLDDSVIVSMVSMKNKGFTHIPIIEDGKLVGVFSKNSIFNYLLEKDVDNLTTSIKFKDIKEYIGLNSENYLFISNKESVFDITDEVLERYKQNKRVSMIFITQDGKEDSKLIGILTPFDLLEY